MIHTTLGALAAAEESIKIVAELKLPVKTSYAMSKLFAAVAAELEHWHKQRVAWVEELGEKNADGVTAVGPSALPEFVTRMNELASVAVELPSVALTLDMFGDAEVSVRDVALLTGAGLLIESAPAPGPHLVKEPNDGERHLQPAGTRR